MTSAAEQLANAAPARTPFDIMRAAFVELHVTDLAASEHFYGELLGMIVSARTEDAVFLRGWEERQHHSLILRQSAPTQPATAARLGFRSAIIPASAPQPPGGIQALRAATVVDAIRLAGVVPG